MDKLHTAALAAIHAAQAASASWILSPSMRTFVDAVLAGYERQVNKLYGLWDRQPTIVWRSVFATLLRALCLDIADALGVPELRKLAEEGRDVG